MMKVVALVLAFACVTYAQTPFTPCAGGLPAPTSVNVHGCTGAICNAPIGSQVVADVTFTAPRAVPAFSPRLIAEFDGNQVEYPLGNPNGCATMQSGGCPLAAGSTNVYRFTFNVLPGYPPVLMNMQLSLIDGDAFNCFHVQVQVQG